MLAYIDWNVNPIFWSYEFSLPEWLPIIGGLNVFALRYYSLLFAIAFWLGYIMMNKMYKKEGIPEEWCDQIFLYTIIATIVGARLGHVFFYGWDYYSQHPIDIIKVWEGGLASHGGTLGILLALYFYRKNVAKDKSYLWVLDHIVVPIGFAAFCIRMGNLFNSEIYGKPTDLPWAFRFLRLHPDEALIPRHPTQIYEAVFYLGTFIFEWYLYWKKDFIKKEGALFGIFMVCIFGFRMIVETLKENQEQFEDGMLLNMGQLLSIPFVIIGAYCIYNALYKKK